MARPPASFQGTHSRQASVRSYRRGLTGSRSADQASGYFASRANVSGSATGRWLQVPTSRAPAASISPANAPLTDGTSIRTRAPVSVIAIGSSRSSLRIVPVAWPSGWFAIARPIVTCLPPAVSVPVQRPASRLLIGGLRRGGASPRIADPGQLERDRLAALRQREVACHRPAIVAQGGVKRAAAAGRVDREPDLAARDGDRTGHHADHPTLAPHPAHHRRAQHDVRRIAVEHQLDPPEPGAQVVERAGQHGAPAFDDPPRKSAPRARFTGV